MELQRFIQRTLTKGCFVAALLASEAGYSIEYYLASNFGLAKISGISQTPKGGNLNTTSWQRPTYTEANIHQDDVNQFVLGITHNDIVSILSHQTVHAQGQASLVNALLTHNQFIEADNAFFMKATYHLNALAIGKKMRFDDPRWQLTPFIESVLVHYKYQFLSDVLSSKRDFSLAGLTIGLINEYLISPQITLSTFIKNSVPLSQLNISQVEGQIHYTQKIKKDFSLSPVLALGWLRINYKDNQLVPNHIRYQALPYASLGFSLTMSH